MPTYSKYSGVGGGGGPGTGIQSINTSTISAQTIVAGNGISVNTVIGTGVTTITNTAPMLSTGNLTSTDITVTGGTGAVIGTGTSLAIVKGNLTEATSSVLTISGGTGAVLGTGTTIQVLQASASQSGYLSSSDFSSFAAKQPAGNYIIALTGEVTATGPGSVAATISNSAVTNAKLANMAANTIKGNNTASPAAPLDLTTAQTTAMLDLFTSALKGLAPASGGGTSNFLRADGTWTVPPGTGANTALSNLVAPTAINQSLLFNPDATYDIGADGASRPAAIHASNHVTVPTVRGRDDVGSAGQHDITVRGGNGATGNKNGGILTLAGGTASGTGTAGHISLLTTGLERMRIAAGGNVGIGTTSPGSKLDVSGSSNLDGAVTVNNSLANVDFTVKGDTDAAALVVDASADSVGIGTATPSVKLDVVGSIKASSDVQSASSNGGQLAGTRNRIINGAIEIDQRNAGASVTLTNSWVYTVDRFAGREDTDGTMTAQQVTDSPSGFTKSLKFTTTTADASLGATQFCAAIHRIEGENVIDFSLGTTSAKQFTLSFWVKSSLTGTFGGSFVNAADNRSYPFTYVINSANTWEQKTVTITGDTTGTWLTDNNIGINIVWGLGVGSTYSGTSGSWFGALYLSATGAVSVIGTLNATWQVTGVQVELGPVATAFEWRNYQQELAMCQRYYYKITNNSGGVLRMLNGYALSTTVAYGTYYFPVPLRIAPTALQQTGTASDYRIYYQNTFVNLSSGPAFAEANNDSATISCTASGLTAGDGVSIGFSSTGSYLAWSAEL